MLKKHHVHKMNQLVDNLIHKTSVTVYYF